MVDAADIAIIIPCFNDGATLKATLLSVQAQKLAAAEVVVVDDGSSDQATIELINNLQEHGCSGLTNFKVLKQLNQGPSSARNTAIENCKAAWILPLDADDLLRPIAINALWNAVKEDSSRGIIYGKNIFFGGRSQVADFPQFSDNIMALGNVIPVSALFKRESWAAVGGYRIAMNSGWEDWDFWLSLLEHGEKVYQLEEIILDIRIKHRSRNRGWSSSERLKLVSMLAGNHHDFFARHITDLLDRVSDLEHQRQTSRYQIIKNTLKSLWRRGSTR